MRKFLQLFSITIFVMTLKPLFAVYMVNKDFIEEGNGLKKRKIIVDFSTTKPKDTDITDIDAFDQPVLQTKLESRINASVVNGYKNNKLEILFRNIENVDHLCAAWIVMKNLGYSKYSNTEPTIFLENSQNADSQIKIGTTAKRNEYHGDGFI